MTDDLVTAWLARQGAGKAYLRGLEYGRSHSQNPDFYACPYAKPWLSKAWRIGMEEGAGYPLLEQPDRDALVEVSAIQVRPPGALREIMPTEIHNVSRETDTGQIMYRFTCRLPGGEMVHIVVPHDLEMTAASRPRAQENSVVTQ